MELLGTMFLKPLCRRRVIPSSLAVAVPLNRIWSAVESVQVSPVVRHGAMALPETTRPAEAVEVRAATALLPQQLGLLFFRETEALASLQTFLDLPNRLALEVKVESEPTPARPLPHL
jgi:hypothetical protein